MSTPNPALESAIVHFAQHPGVPHRGQSAACDACIGPLAHPVLGDICCLRRTAWVYRGSARRSESNGGQHA
jgi:hypothetical protein